MKNFTADCEKLIENLLLELQEKASKVPDMLSCADICLSKCADYLERLRLMVLENGFPDRATEIHFFKKVKPVILSRLRYYRSILDLHLDMCPGGTHTEGQQLIAALDETTQFFEKHREFYNYYRTGKAQFDDVLFVRGQRGISLYRISNYDIDPDFATGYDGMIGEFIGYELFIEYLKNRLDPDAVLQQGNEKPAIPTFPCTATSTDIVELSYAFFLLGICGQKTVKEVIHCFATWLQVDVKACYMAFNQISKRKITKTKFLDKLREALIKYIEQLSD